MSYRLTEAERKHVAVIEETSLDISLHPNQQKEVIITLKDNDVLDKTITLPHYKLNYIKDRGELHLYTDSSPFDLDEWRDVGYRYDLKAIKSTGGYLHLVEFWDKNTGDKDSFFDFNKLIANENGNPDRLTPIEIYRLKVPTTTNLSGAVTLDTTLGVSGAVTLDKTLNVTGKTTLNTAGNTTEILNVNGISNFSGTVNIKSGDLTVTDGKVEINSPGKSFNITNNTTTINSTASASLRSSDINIISDATAYIGVEDINEIDKSCIAFNSTSITESADYVNISGLSSIQISGKTYFENDVYISGITRLKEFHAKNITVDELYNTSASYLSGLVKIGTDGIPANLDVSGNVYINISGDNYTSQAHFVDENISIQISGDSVSSVEISQAEIYEKSNAVNISGNVSISGINETTNALFVSGDLEVRAPAGIGLSVGTKYITISETNDIDIKGDVHIDGDVSIDCEVNINEGDFIITTKVLDDPDDPDSPKHSEVQINALVKTTEGLDLGGKEITGLPIQTKIDVITTANDTKAATLGAVSAIRSEIFGKTDDTAFNTISGIARYIGSNGISGTLDTVSGKIETLFSEYTFVVDDKSSFDKWANATPADVGAYEVVLVKGEFEVTTPLNLAAAGTKKIVGLPGNKITFKYNDWENDTTLIGTKTATTLLDTIIEGLNISVDLGTKEITGLELIGFGKCSNLYNCKIEVGGTVKPTLYTAFNECESVEKCVVKGKYNNGTNIGFSNCYAVRYCRIDGFDVSVDDKYSNSYATFDNSILAKDGWNK
jgi:hypothetical protein